MPKPTNLLYRVVLGCRGVPPGAAHKVAREITEEFTHRPWHRNAVCTWDGHALLLQAENDFDPAGIALMDEFSDAITAYAGTDFDGDIYMLSAEVSGSRNPTSQL